SSAQRVAYWTVRASSRVRPGLRFGVPLISIDDALHERVAHHVARLKIGKGDAAHALQYDARLDESAFVAARQVDLRDVAGNDRFAAETDARQEHFHLFRRRVLRFVEDHERLRQRAPAHERKGCYFDRAALEQ